MYLLQIWKNITAAMAIIDVLEKEKYTRINFRRIEIIVIFLYLNKYKSNGNERTRNEENPIGLSKVPVRATGLKS